MRDWVITAETDALDVGGEVGAWCRDLELACTTDEVEDGEDTHV